MCISDYLQILESQRPTSRNFSVYLDAKKSQNNNNNNNGNKKRAKEKKNNISHYNYKLKNNKEHQPATKATAGDNGEGGGGPAAGSTFTSGDEDNANFGRQSFAYKKFKNMHEQQNQQHQEQQEEQPHLPKEQRKRGDDGQQLLEESQLFDSIEILNERKFNKPSQAPKEQQQQQQRASQVDQEAIGDIEDNLDNDEALPTDDDDDDEDEDPSEDGSENLDIKLPSDNDGLGKLTTTTARTTTLATSKATTTTTRVTPTTTTTTTLTPTPSPTTTSSTMRSPIGQSPIIGHKQKRHGGGNVFGLKRPQYYGNNYEIGRVRQQEQEPELGESEEVEDLNLGEMHYYDNGNVNRKLATFDMTRPENLEENSLGSPLKKLQQPRFVDDDYAEPQPPAEEEEKSEVEQVEKSDLDSEWQRYRQGK